MVDAIISPIATQAIGDMSYQSRTDGIEPAVDIVDRALAIAWIAAEIALDVFGLFFWSALGLCLATILT